MTNNQSTEQATEFKRVTIVSVSAGRYWTAWVYTAGVLQTTGRGRDEGAAVADAVAAFRMARSDRRSVALVEVTL